MARKEPEPIRITTATRGHTDDIGARQKRYIISMAIRTACFILAIVTRGHWYSWVLIGAAFVLPYIAVVMANAGASADPGGPGPYDPNSDQKSLEGPTPS